MPLKVELSIPQRCHQAWKSHFNQLCSRVSKIDGVPPLNGFGEGSVGVPRHMYPLRLNDVRFEITKAVNLFKAGERKAAEKILKSIKALGTDFDVYKTFKEMLG